MDKCQSMKMTAIHSNTLISGCISAIFLKNTNVCDHIHPSVILQTIKMMILGTLTIDI